MPANILLQGIRGEGEGKEGGADWWDEKSGWPGSLSGSQPLPVDCYFRFSGIRVQPNVLHGWLSRQDQRTLSTLWPYRSRRLQPRGSVYNTALCCHPANEARAPTTPIWFIPKPNPILAGPSSIWSFADFLSYIGSDNGDNNRDRFATKGLFPPAFSAHS